MQDNTLSGVWIFLSNFQVTLSNATSITMSSFLDIGNGLFTTVTPLGSTAALVSPPLVVGFNETDSTNANADGSFSVTALYHIVAAAGSHCANQHSNGSRSACRRWHTGPRICLRRPDAVVAAQTAC